MNLILFGIVLKVHGTKSMDNYADIKKNMGIVMLLQFLIGH
jgi:hypothetical protein